MFSHNTCFTYPKYFFVPEAVLHKQSFCRPKKIFDFWNNPEACMRGFGISGITIIFILNIIKKKKNLNTGKIIVLWYFK